MDQTAPAQRSTFLTVLCILSFISGLWTLRSEGHAVMGAARPRVW